MSVPAIALYASPPSGVCPGPHLSSQIAGSHSSQDFDLYPRPTASSSSTSPSSSASSQKPMAGGLSCLFSSPVTVTRHGSSSSFTCAGVDQLSPLWRERSDDLGSSYSYSPYPSSSSFKCRDHSPSSVFQGPVSCSGSGASRSSPVLRAPRDWMGSDWRVGRDRLFIGFVRNALGSCLDYELPSLPLPEEIRADSAELTFELDESLVGMEPLSEPCTKQLLVGAQSRHKIFFEGLVVKAFYEAEKAHRGQMRASGDPYLQHCVETAVLLAGVGANVTVVSAGLLHDTIDDSFMDYDHIFHMFGASVADLVEGVSKLSQLSQLARDSNTASKIDEADRLHTMFLAMADARAVLIKLADRLHNMMTLEALPVAKQQRFAMETLEIFVPLANRLGIYSWKEQLESLCFKHLNAEQHRELSSKLVECFDEALVTSAIEKLEKGLQGEGLPYHALSGRHKSLYSIYSKMLKKKLTMDEIHDIHGLRLIVEKQEDCYRALDIVHKLWPQVLGRFKDYISQPKLNGYQSLHTVVLSEDAHPLEVQIRTREMHLQAEYGFAAHWRYKEGSCKHSFVLQMVEWARWALNWQCEAMRKDHRPSTLGNSDVIWPLCSFPSHSDDCPYSYTQQCNHDGPLFIVLVENEKISVQEVPANSTVMDLLERQGIWSSRRNPNFFPLKLELRPRVNHEPVSEPTQKLKMGDVVELTPALPDKSRTEYIEEIQRMYEGGLALSGQSGWPRR